MHTLNEEWKPLSKKFIISSLGRVFNLETKEFHRPSIHKSRANYYLRIYIENKNYMLHVLVALHFHTPPTPEHTQVDHKDGNTLNPAATNVAWITPTNNKYKMWEQRKVKYGDMVYRGKNKKLIIRKKVHR